MKQKFITIRHKGKSKHTRILGEVEFANMIDKDDFEIISERARNEKGQLKADDPSTPDVNEAWKDGKGPKKKKKAKKKKAKKKK
mgnify:CR=1 FL=1